MILRCFSLFYRWSPHYVFPWLLLSLCDVCVIVFLIKKLVRLYLGLTVRLYFSLIIFLQALFPNTVTVEDTGGYNSIIWIMGRQNSTHNTKWHILQYQINSSSILNKLVYGIMKIECAWFESQLWYSVIDAQQKWEPFNLSTLKDIRFM